jgi:hypothetical protein
MSNSSEFCGDHVNLFRGFLARMSHPNKLPLSVVCWSRVRRGCATVKGRFSTRDLAFMMPLTNQ